MLRNKKQNVQMEGNLKFGVQFGGNHATVTTSGPVTIKTGVDTFSLDKSIPNMLIQNVVWGVKYVMWDGDITLSCEKTGYACPSFHFVTVSDTLLPLLSLRSTQLTTDLKERSISTETKFTSSTDNVVSQ